MKHLQDLQINLIKPDFGLFFNIVFSSKSVLLGAERDTLKGWVQDMYLRKRGVLGYFFNIFWYILHENDIFPS